MVYLICFAQCISGVGPTALSSIQAEQGVRGTVREALQQHFAGEDAQLIEACQVRVELLLAAASDPAVKAMTLRDLSGAAQYHASRMRSRLREGPQTGDSARILRNEGVKLELDYLYARVQRTLTRDETPAGQALRRTQIDSLFESAKVALAERIIGDGTRELVASHLDPIREIWLDSITTAFNSCLERPLTEDELRQTRDHIRSLVLRHSVTHLTPEDIAAPEKLGRSGALKVVEDAIKGLYKATGIANRDLSEFEVKREEWQAKVRAAAQEAKVTVSTPEIAGKSQARVSETPPVASKEHRLQNEAVPRDVRAVPPPSAGSSAATWAALVCLLFLVVAWVAWTSWRKAH